MIDIVDLIFDKEKFSFFSQSSSVLFDIFLISLIANKVLKNKSFDEMFWKMRRINVKDVFGRLNKISQEMGNLFHQILNIQ